MNWALFPLGIPPPINSEKIIVKIGTQPRPPPSLKKTIFVILESCERKINLNIA